MEDLAMRNAFDITPFWRSSIGFDRLFDLVNAAQQQAEAHYPHYNIEKLGEDRYQISVALAGFRPEEISITAEQNILTVEGCKTDEKRQYLYQGISERQFRRQFNLADYVEVRSATFDNGLLRIELVREIPEAMKPRRIPVNGAPNVQQLDAKVAA